MITPDLIPDEADEWIAVSDAHNLDRIFLVAPSSTPERLAATVDGVARIRLRGVDDGCDRCTRRGVRSPRPSWCGGSRRFPTFRSASGWGCGRVSRPPQIGAYADGVIVGSALVSALTEGLPALRALTEELADGVRQRISA